MNRWELTHGDLPSRRRRSPRCWSESGTCVVLLKTWKKW